MKHFLRASACCVLLLAGCDFTEDENPYCGQWRTEYQNKDLRLQELLTDEAAGAPEHPRIPRRIMVNSLVDEMNNLAHHMNYKQCKDSPSPDLTSPLL